MYTNLRQLKQWQPLKDVFGSFLCTSYCARCTPLINIIGSKSRTLTQQKSRLFSSSTFCANLFCNDILLMDKTYRPSIFSVLLQQAKIKRARWPTFFISLLNSTLKCLHYM